MILATTPTVEFPPASCVDGKGRARQAVTACAETAARVPHAVGPLAVGNIDCEGFSMLMVSASGRAVQLG